jgi:hypothetical protein
MKRLTTVIAVSLIIAAPAVWAAGSENQRGHGGIMMSPDQMQEMQQNMSQMQGMTSQMQQNSGQDHHELMEEHMERMQKQMHMMRGGMMGSRGMMNGQGMMSGQGMKGDSNQGQSTIKPEDRFEFMEKRMDQMQLMMEQMLEHQQLLQGRTK